MFSASVFNEEFIRGILFTASWLIWQLVWILGIIRGLLNLASDGF
jgi:hypothetical protein